MMNFFRKRWVQRVFILLVGLSIAFMGLNAYRRNAPGYQNYWGGFVARGAAVCIGLGVVGLACAPARVYDRKRTREKPKSRADRLAARKKLSREK